MLCLTRRRGEEVIIEAGGEVIVVRYLEHQQGRLKLGFEAGPHVRINRREVWERINREAFAGQQDKEQEQ